MKHSFSQNAKLISRDKLIVFRTIWAVTPSIWPSHTLQNFWSYKLYPPPPPSRVLNCHILAGEFSKMQHPLNNACKIMITTVNECMSAGRWLFLPRRRVFDFVRELIPSFLCSINAPCCQGLIAKLVFHFVILSAITVFKKQPLFSELIDDCLTVVKIQRRPSFV